MIVNINAYGLVYIISQRMVLMVLFALDRLAAT
jgi:hypothetical protein